MTMIRISRYLSARRDWRFFGGSLTDWSDVLRFQLICIPSHFETLWSQMNTFVLGIPFSSHSSVPFPRLIIGFSNCYQATHPHSMRYDSYSSVGACLSTIHAWLIRRLVSCQSQSPFLPPATLPPQPIPPSACAPCGPLISRATPKQTIQTTSNRTDPSERCHAIQK